MPDEDKIRFVRFSEISALNVINGTIFSSYLSPASGNPFNYILAIQAISQNHEMDARERSYK